MKRMSKLAIALVCVLLPTAMVLASGKKKKRSSSGTKARTSQERTRSEIAIELADAKSPPVLVPTKAPGCKEVFRDWLEKEAPGLSWAILAQIVAQLAAADDLSHSYAHHNLVSGEVTTTAAVITVACACVQAIIYGKKALENRSYLQELLSNALKSKKESVRKAAQNVWNKVKASPGTTITFIGEIIGLVSALVLLSSDSKDEHIDAPKETLYNIDAILTTIVTGALALRWGVKLIKDKCCSRLPAWCRLPRWLSRERLPQPQVAVSVPPVATMATPAQPVADRKEDASGMQSHDPALLPV